MTKMKTGHDFCSKNGGSRKFFEPQSVPGNLPVTAIFLERPGKSV
jgi:hypothetical protein